MFISTGRASGVSIARLYATDTWRFWNTILVLQAQYNGARVYRLSSLREKLLTMLDNAIIVGK